MSVLQRKVQKVLASRTKVDSQEITTALTALSDLYGENTASSRRRLRSELERRGVLIDRQMVQAFAEVKTELAAVEQSINELNEGCAAILARIHSARETTASLVAQTNELQAQKATARAHCEIATAFLQRFQLTAEETKALDSEEISPAFFRALDRIAQIRNDCKELLQTYQRVGLDIMDSLAKRLEVGYEKLYRWVQTEGRALPQHEVPPTFVAALALLRHMPVYYSHCCQEIVQARRLALIRRFMAALSRGGPDGASRAIEMHAHDPIRYVSDMLAWVHESVASERDFLGALLIPDYGKGGLLTAGDAPSPTALAERKTDAPAATATALVVAPSTAAPEAKKDDVSSSAPAATMADVAGMLAMVFEGISRPLKSRVEQALSTQPTAVTLYKLLNVLEFYTRTIAPLLPEASQFRQTLDSLCENARRSFFELVQKQGEKLVRSPPPFTHDLSPPRIITDAIGQLSQVMAVYSSSLLSSAQRDHDFAPVLAAMVDPIVQSAQLSGGGGRVESASEDGGEASDAAVFQLNVIAAVQAALRKAEFARSRLETLSLQANACLDALINAQANAVLKKCGLADKLSKLQQFLTQPPESKDSSVVRFDKLSHVPGMDSTSLTAAFQAFYGSLVSGGLFVLPHCDRLSVPATRRACREAVARIVSAGYLALFQAISDTGNGYTDVRAILLHTPEQVNTLLELRSPATPVAAASPALALRVQTSPLAATTTTLADGALASMPSSTVARPQPLQLTPSVSTPKT